MLPDILAQSHIVLGGQNRLSKLTHGGLVREGNVAKGAGIISIYVLLSTKAKKDQVIEALQHASEGPLKGWIRLTDQESQATSTQFLDERSAVVIDVNEIRAVGGNMVHIMGWFHERGGAEVIKAALDQTLVDKGKGITRKELGKLKKRLEQDL